MRYPRTAQELKSHIYGSLLTCYPNWDVIKIRKDEITLKDRTVKFQTHFNVEDKNNHKHAAEATEYLLGL